MIAAIEGTQMWDVRYKYPYESVYTVEDKETGQQIQKTSKYYTVAGAKCIAPTAERAIELLKALNPDAVVVGIHLREGGDKNRVLIAPEVLPSLPPVITWQTGTPEDNAFTPEQREKLLAELRNAPPPVLVPGPPVFTVDEQEAVLDAIDILDAHAHQTGKPRDVVCFKALRSLLKKYGGK